MYQVMCKVCRKGMSIVSNKPKSSGVCQPCSTVLLGQKEAIERAKQQAINSLMGANR